MANKRLRFLAILAMCCFSISGVSAYVADWTGPVTLTNANSFVAVAIDVNNDLYIDGTITFNQNVTIDALNSIPGNSVRVFIGETSTGPGTGQAILQPHASGGYLIFHAPTGKNIDVWIPPTNDFFTQANAVGPVDMNLTFSGAGMTTFHIGGMDPDRTSASYSYGRVVFDDTNVWVTMDQTQQQAETDHENKVVFQRGGYLGNGVWTDAGNLYLNDYNNTYSGWPVVVQFDTTLVHTGSNFLYVSNEDGTTIPAVSDGAFAFDTSNQGKGVFELIVTDSVGFVVAGHHITTAQFTNPTGLPTASVDVRYAAGNRAILRVIDDLAANAIGGGYSPGDQNRRGLLVVNSNEQHGLLASDPYSFVDLGGMSSFFSFAWPNMRKGFVVGMNGNLDVYNNRFMHYFSYRAENLYDVDVQAYNGINSTFSPIDPDLYLKRKNPAALIVDGFNRYTGLFIIPSYPFPIDDYQAQILLRGDGRLHMSAALGGDGRNYPVTFPYDFYPDTDLNYFFSGVAGGNTALIPNVYTDTAIFNGDWVGLDSAITMSGEGIHVLDVEGEVDVRCLADSPNIGDVAQTGFINLASMQLDYNGAEATYDWNAVLARYAHRDLSRPLSFNSMYPVYRSTSMLFNNVASFYDTEIRHNDVLKRVLDRPIYCEPAMIGGDRMFYWESLLGFGTIPFPPIGYPELRLYNSSLTMHESLSPSGVRFIVKQNYETDVAETGQNNESSFVFYNHGDLNDMQWRGFGRAFVLGNPHNYMGDNLPNAVMESAYVDIFRSRNLPLDAGTPQDRTIKLALNQRDEDGVTPNISGQLGDKNEATHLFLFTKGAVGMSCMSLGWTSSRGFDEAAIADNPFSYPWTPMPWSYSSGPSNSGVDIDALTIDGIHVGVSPGTLSIEGGVGTTGIPYNDSWIYFGSRKYNYNAGWADSAYWTRDWKAIEEPYMTRFPVRFPYTSPVLYVNHGGELTITDYNDCIFDTVIAARLWYDYQSSDWQSTPESQRHTMLSGIVDLPHDQVLFTPIGSIQPYGYLEAMSDAAASTGGILRLKAYMSDRTKEFNKASGEEITIDWSHRPIDYNQDPFKSKKLSKKTRTLKRLSTRTVMTRSTQPVTDPIAMPADLLYFAEGDKITQLRVAGATQADSFHLFATGALESHGYSVIDEIVSVKTEDMQALPSFNDYYSFDRNLVYPAPTFGSIPGEGAHGVIIIDGGANVGLGSRNWNEHSVNAWNKLGRDYVTVVPYGFGKILMNNDLLVTDPLAVIPAIGFGEVRDEGSLVEGSHQRLTFYSEDEHEMIVPENGTLDLRAFGKRSIHEPPETTPIRQELAFGGKAKLVLKRGATIRFPDTLDTNVTFVLYFNDESQLIFDGAKENGKPRFIDAADADEKRIKIMGKGEIWVNKDAKVKVNNAAWVGVQADAENTETDITISLQRQGSMEIGTDQMAGGAFEIGNPVYVPGGATIAFKLGLNGPFSEFHIDREGFLGLGAGVINKDGNINGNAIAAENPASYDTRDGFYVFNKDPLKAWEVHPLYNVENITIDITKGSFDHSNIFDGSDTRASLIAVAGPHSEYIGSITYNFNIFDPDKAIIRGGGNMMYIPEGHDPVDVNVWSWAGPIGEGPTGERVDSLIRYGILASEPVMVQQVDDNFPNSTVVENVDLGKEFTSGTGAAFDFFNFMAYPLYNGSKPSPYSNFGLLPDKHICIGQTQFDVFDDYVYLTYSPVDDLYAYGDASGALTLRKDLHGGSYENYIDVIANYLIVRESSPQTIGGGIVKDAINEGVLGTTGASIPEQYEAPDQYNH